MSAESKFLFENTFEVPGLNPEPEEVVPTFGEEDLVVARDEGFKAGHSAGLEEANRQVESQLARTLGAMQTALGGIATSQIETLEGACRDATEIALTVARKVAPELAQRHGLDEIVHLINGCLHDLMDEPRIVVRLHDSLLDAVKSRIEPLAAEVGFAGQIVFIASGDFGATDCRVEWADGGAERDLDRLDQEIEAAVKLTFTPAPTTSQPAPPAFETPNSSLAGEQ